MSSIDIRALEAETTPGMNQNSYSLVRHVAATVLYVAFAVYLYQPRFGAFTGWQWLLPVNACASREA